MSVCRDGSRTDTGDKRNHSDHAEHHRSRNCERELLGTGNHPDNAEYLSFDDVDTVRNAAIAKFNLRIGAVAKFHDHESLAERPLSGGARDYGNDELVYRNDEFFRNCEFDGNHDSVDWYDVEHNEYDDLPRHDAERIRNSIDDFFALPANDWSRNNGNDSDHSKHDAGYHANDYPRNHAWNHPIHDAVYHAGNDTLYHARDNSFDHAGHHSDHDAWSGYGSDDYHAAIDHDSAPLKKDRSQANSHQFFQLMAVILFASRLPICSILRRRATSAAP